MTARLHAASPAYVVLQQAVAAHKAGLFPDAERLYRKALALQPESGDIIVNLAIVLRLQGKLHEAITTLQKYLAGHPSHPRGYFHLGELFAHQGNHGDAIAAYRRAIDLKPDYAEAYNNLGNVLLQMGEVREAGASYRKAIGLRAEFPEALNNLANVAMRNGRPDEALPALRRALGLKPKYAEARNSLGNALAMLQRLDEAAAEYTQAIELQPNYAEAHGNLGNLHLTQRKFDVALESLGRAVTLEPKSAPSQNSLGNALKELFRLDEAEKAYRKAITIDPRYAPAHQNLARLLCERDSLDEAFSHFVRSGEITYNQQPSHGEDAAHKTFHDSQQQRWLASHGLSTNEFHVELAERTEGPVINRSNDEEKISKEWLSSTPQIVIIDDILVPEAIAALRKVCWGSTIWRKCYAEGYLGAMPEDGFAPPMLAQLAEELRRTYPAIFASHPLLHHWAFKYDSARKGIRIHADFAAVNVNLWITPDEANLDPQSGGLLVWDAAAPSDWDFDRYNSSEKDIRDHLARSGSKYIRIPYRSNRAVIFDSDLFHETDEISFQEGYENRRMNVTLLYGRR